MSQHFEQLIPTRTRRKRLAWIETIFFGLFWILAIRYAFRLTKYREWGDESETVVTAKMMAAGQSLYSEIFNHHGPLTFLPGYLLESVFQASISNHRIFIVLLQIGAMVAIHQSPIFSSTRDRNIFTALCTGVLLLVFPKIFGHMYLYQNIAGLLLIICLAQYTFPAVFTDTPPRTWRVVLANFLLGCLPFLAVTYGPTSVLLFLASLKRGHFRSALIGYISGVVFNLALIEYYSSFAGFLAFHIYLNLKVLPLFLEPAGFIETLILKFAALKSNALATLGLIVGSFVLSVSIHAYRSPRTTWRIGLIVSAVLVLLIRNFWHFQALPFFYVALALPALWFLRPMVQNNVAIQGIALIILCWATVKISLVDSSDRRKLSDKNIPSTTEFSVLVKKLTNPGDKIIAYSFNNFEYLASDRMPASGYFFYLPWQQAYNQHPVLDIKIDPCNDIATYQPKVMLIDKWNVFAMYPWENYGQCIDDLLRDRYSKLGERPFYVRNDIADTFKLR